MLKTYKLLSERGKQDIHTDRLYIYVYLNVNIPKGTNICRKLMATLSSVLAVPVINTIRWPSPPPGTHEHNNIPTAISGITCPAFTNPNVNYELKKNNKFIV